MMEFFRYIGGCSKPIELQRAANVVQEYAEAIARRTLKYFGIT